MTIQNQEKLIKKIAAYGKASHDAGFLVAKADDKSETSFKKRSLLFSEITKMIVNEG